MPLATRDNSIGEDNATQANSAATFPASKDNLANKGSASLSPRNKGKKRRRASFGVGQGKTPNARGPKVAGVIRKVNEKQGRKAGSWDDSPSPPEQESDRSPRGSDWDAESRMFAGVIVQRFDDIKCSLKVHAMI
jgi:hypothetical protein